MFFKRFGYYVTGFIDNQGFKRANRHLVSPALDIQRFFIYMIQHKSKDIVPEAHTEVLVKYRKRLFLDLQRIYVPVELRN